MVGFVSIIVFYTSRFAGSVSIAASKADYLYLTK